MSFNNRATGSAITHDTSKSVLHITTSLHTKGHFQHGKNAVTTWCALERPLKCNGLSEVFTSITNFHSIQRIVIPMSLS
jgi:hypothetical protein